MWQGDFLLVNTDMSNEELLNLCRPISLHLVLYITTVKIVLLVLFLVQSTPFSQGFFMLYYVDTCILLNTERYASLICSLLLYENTIVCSEHLFSEVLISVNFLRNLDVDNMLYVKLVFPKLDSLPCPLLYFYFVL